ncbi:MAG TPA: hypothetical protein VHT52_08235 [Stellaceae bacterium]|nr:hypothetical protein [Stellaceae bacterium]
MVDLFSDRSVRRPLIVAFLMMLSVTFAFWGVGTFIPTYVGSVAAKAGLSAPAWAGWAGLITAACGTVGFVVRPLGSPPANGSSRPFSAT